MVIYEGKDCHIIGEVYHWNGTVWSIGQRREKDSYKINIDS